MADVVGEVGTDERLAPACGTCRHRLPERVRQCFCHPRHLQSSEIDRAQPHLEVALVVDGSDALRAATVLGAGIAQAGVEGTAPLLASGALVTVLDAHAPPPWAVWMLRAPGPAGPALAATMEAVVKAFRPKAGVTG